MHIGLGTILIVLAFFVGAWAGTKYPATNLIGKVTG
jgi:hypothetical protein